MALVLFLIIRTFLVEAFQIPSGSMERTLLVGDFLFVNKAAYGAQIPGTGARLPGFAIPARGDIVVFGYPKNPEQHYVKRVIGMPGDRISVRFEEGDPVVLLQPQGQDTTFVVDNPAWGDQVSTATTTCCDRNGIAVGTPRTTVVPDGSYWLIGDNWGGSDDSRKFGFVRKDHIHARLNFRLLPLGSFGKVDAEVFLREP